MPRIAEWRGKPNTTTFAEALQVFRLAKLSKKDVFYDLGCGHGWVCIWASRFCKTAKGIDDIKKYVLRARQNAQKHRLKNVRIIHGDIVRCRFPDADVLYCVTDISLKNFGRWNRRTRKKTLRIVTLGPPPIPIKPVATSGTFCLTGFPLQFVRSLDDWYLAVLGKRNGSWTQVHKKFWKLSTEALRSLRHDFKRYYG